MGVVIALGLKEPIGGVIAALLSGVVGWFASPYMWRRTIRRNLLRLAKGDGLGTLGAHTLSLEADGIREATTSRAGQHSIRVGDQFRICFRWNAAGAEDVEIVDYH